MADRKRNAARSSAALKSSSDESGKTVKAPARASEREQRSESTQTARARTASVARQERRESREKAEVKAPARKEAKKSASMVTRLRGNSFGRFIYDAYYELRHKVTWPTPKEARNMTIAVVALSAVVGGIIALADFGLLHLFRWIIGQ